MIQPPLIFTMRSRCICWLLAAFSLVAGGCHHISYSDGDSPLLHDRFGRLDLMTTTGVSLPIVENRCLYNAPPPGIGGARVVELSTGTRLRVVHFETAVEKSFPMAVRLPVTAQAEVSEGQHVGLRVVVGSLADDKEGPYIVTVNRPQGLSPQVGQAIEVVDAKNSTLLSHDSRQ